MILACYRVRACHQKQPNMHILILEFAVGVNDRLPRAVWCLVVEWDISQWRYAHSTVAF
jgi:hypothetical protein